MGNFSLDTFTTAFKGGARSYLFKVNLGGLTTDLTENSIYYVKSTTFPGTTIEENTTSYQFIDFKSPNKKKFDDWTITFNADRKGDLRMAFEKWTQKLHFVGNNDNNGEGFNNMIDMPSDPISKNIVFQLLDYDMTETLKIKLVGAWPKAISSMTLDYGSQDIMTFDVTFSYIYHNIYKSNVTKNQI